jgi:two-component system cell cycle response regulator DivK
MRGQVDPGAGGFERSLGDAPARKRLTDWVSFAEARQLLAGMSVLVFDADTEASGRIFISLGQVGASVRLARRTIQGLRMMEEQTPGLIIVATAMPDTEPLAFVRRLAEWAASRGTRLVALGARNTRSERRRFLAAACDGFVSKPVDARLFAQELARELGA